MDQQGPPQGLDQPASDSRFQFRQGHQGQRPHQGPPGQPAQGGAPRQPGQMGPPRGAPQQGYSTTTYEGVNATANYKPYTSPDEKKQLEERRKFEDESAWQRRKEAQQKRNKIIVVAALVGILIFIFAAIAVILIVVPTYSTPATLNAVNASPDFDDLRWEVTGSVEIIEEPLKLTDISIRVSGSAVADAESKDLFESQWPIPAESDPGTKYSPGSVIDFKITVPMKARVKGSPAVSVTLSVDGAKVETTEIDVSRYYTDGEI